MESAKGMYLSTLNPRANHGILKARSDRLTVGKGGTFMIHYNPLLQNMENSKKFITMGEIMLRLDASKLRKDSHGIRI